MSAGGAGREGGLGRRACTGRAGQDLEERSGQTGTCDERLLPAAAGWPGLPARRVRDAGSPAAVLAAVAAGAEAVLGSPAMVGLNLVAPEAAPLALRDYWIHMQTFKFIGEQFPDVPFALHAGELEQGLVRGAGGWGRR